MKPETKKKKGMGLKLQLGAGHEIPDKEIGM